MGISKHLLSPPAKCTTSLPEANNIPFPLPFIHPLEHTLSEPIGPEDVKIGLQLRDSSSSTLSIQSSTSAC